MKVSAKKILFTDYLAFLCFLFSIGFIILGPGVILVWLVAFPVAIIRILSIKNVFAKDVVVKGVITKRWFFRHGSRLRYAFAVDGKSYDVGNFMYKKTLPYQVGDSVDVVYLPSNPKKAFLVDIYTK